MPTFVQDFRYSVRTLARTKALTVVAAVTLAFGIGANTAIFSIIDTALLRPLPYREPAQLVRLYETESAPGNYPFAGPDFLDWRSQNKTLQGMSLYTWPRDMNINNGDRPDNVRGVATDANFFSLLGIPPMLGRTWIEGEDQPGKDKQVVLSYGLWKSQFAGDPGVLNRVIELNSEKYTVVGVMPASFLFPTRAQLWIPQPMDAKALGTRGSHWAAAVGRLRPGVSPQQARADLAVIAANLERQFPDSNGQVGASVVPLRDDLVGDTKNSFFLMLGAVGLVLLIACANVANLMLSRAFARQKEMALRCALGASRWRIIRQLLIESSILGLFGGVLGLALGWGIIQAFSRSTSSLLPRFSTLELNGSVLAFTFALALATGLLFGLVPALQASRPDLIEELKGGAGSAISPNKRRRFAGSALVVGEIALSMLLLVCAGLLLEDFFRLRSLNIGVRTEGVWTGGVALTGPGYEKGETQWNFARAMLERAKRIPGVDVAAITSCVPPDSSGNYYIQIRGRDPHAKNSQLVERHSISADYFRVMGISLRQGRLFTETDHDLTLRLRAQLREMFKDDRQPTPEATNAIVFPVVINEAMARHFWPGANPIGEMFGNGVNGPWRQVVGVVSNVRDRGLMRQPAPEAYDLHTGERAFLRGGPYGRGGVVTGGPDASRIGRRRCRAAVLLGAYDGRSNRDERRRAAVPEPAGGFVRRAGATALGSRNLRGAVLHGDAADARDRHSHVARREPATGVAGDSAAGRDTRRLRPGDRISRGVGRVACNGEPAARSPARRPDGDDRHRTVPGDGVARGLPAAGASRLASRPAGRTPVRIVPRISPSEEFSLGSNPRRPRIPPGDRGQIPVAPEFKGPVWSDSTLETNGRLHNTTPRCPRRWIRLGRPDGHVLRISPAKIGIKGQIPVAPEFAHSRDHSRVTAGRSRYAMQAGTRSSTRVSPLRDVIRRSPFSRRARSRMPGSPQ